MNHQSYTSSTETRCESGDEPVALWRNANFLLFGSGQFVSALGSRVSALALPLLVLALTSSPAQAGLIAALQMLPYLLLSMPVGVLVDHWDRKRVMIYCDLLRWLASGTVPLVFFVTGGLHVEQLYLVALIDGCANVFFSLAQISALPRVVQPEHIPRAYALSEVVDHMAALLGPNLGALVINLARSTVIGAALAYLVDSLSYLVSALMLRLIRVPFQDERGGEPGGSLWGAMVEGLRFLWKQPLLRIMVLLTTSINFFQVSVQLAVIVLIRDTLHLDTTTLGLIVGAYGIGGLVGGFLGPWVRERFRFGHIILVSILAWVMAYVLIAFASSAFLLMLGRMIVGLIWPVYAVALVSYRLVLVPDALLGRVNSSFRFLSYGIEVIGATAGGLLLLVVSPRLALALAAVGLALSALIAGFTSLRRTQ
jgi:MFS family permease